MQDFDEDVIKNEVLDALLQVDDTFVIDTFSCEFSRNNRSLKVTFTAHNADGEEVEVDDVWQD